MAKVNFTDFMTKNRARAYELAKANTNYDSHGHVVINPDSDIAKDVFWDHYFERIGAHERD